MSLADADTLIRQGDELMLEKRDYDGAVQSYLRAAELYQRIDEVNLAASALMKIGLGLHEVDALEQEAIAAYEKAAELYRKDGNVERSSNALLSAAMVAARVKRTALAVSLFVSAGHGFDAVADTYWSANRYQVAWDTLHLACMCWKHALTNLGVVQSREMPVAHNPNEGITNDYR